MNDHITFNDMDLSKIAVQVDDVEALHVPEPTETAAELLTRLRAEEGRPLRRARHLHLVSSRPVDHPRTETDR